MLPLLLLGAALAAVPTDRLDDEIALAVQNTGGKVLVATPGFGGRAAVEQALAAHPGLDVRLETLADAAAVDQELARAGLRCGLLVVGAGAGAWEITRRGPCTPAPVVVAFPMTPPPVPAPAPVAPAPAAPPPAARDLAAELAPLPAPERERALTEALVQAAADPAASAPLAAALAVSRALAESGRADPSIVKLFLRAALSADEGTRAAAVTAARAGGDPPTGVSAAPPPPAPPPAVAPPPASAADPAKLRAYRQRYLKRDKLEITELSSYFGGPWATTTITWGVFDGGGTPFPARAFSREVGDRATTERLTRWRTAGYVGGTLLTLAGVGGLAAAVGAASGDDTAAVFGWGLAGTVGLVGGPMWIIAAPYYQQFVGRTYTPAEADRLIEAHNAALRRELGLTQADVQEIDLR